MKVAMTLILWLSFVPLVLLLKIQKFCPEKQVYFLANKTCGVGNVTLYDLVDIPKFFQIVVTRLDCENIQELSPDLDHSLNFTLSEEGALLIPGRNWKLEPETFLLETFYDGKLFFKKSFFCETDLIANPIVPKAGTIRKCCGLNELLLVSDYGVVQCVNTAFLTYFRTFQNENQVIVRACETANFQEFEVFQMLSGGGILLDSGDEVDITQYCLDDVIGGLQKPKIYPTLTVLKCSGGPKENPVKLSTILDDENARGPKENSVKQSTLFDYENTSSPNTFVTHLNSQSNAIKVAEQPHALHIPLCCPNYQIMTLDGTCSDSEVPLLVRVQFSRWLSYIIHNIVNLNSVKTLSTELVHSKLTCSNPRFTVLKPTVWLRNIEQNLRIENGTVSITMSPVSCSNIGRKVVVDSYCVSPALTGIPDAPYAMFFYYCADGDNVQSLTRDVSVLYPTLIFCSAFSFAITIVVYVTAPPQVQVSTVIFGGSVRAVRSKKVRLISTLFGKLLVFHMACLLFGFLSLGLVQSGAVKVGEQYCVLAALSVYLFFTGAFAWLTVLCFELWWQFRETKRSNNRRLIPYSFFGFGFPVTMTTLAATAEFWSSSCEVLPHFNFDRCWFYGDYSLLLFFYGPITVLVGLNLMFFALTLFNVGICACQSSVQRLTVQSSSNRSNKLLKNKLMLTLKLLIVMGVPWVTEIIAWAPRFNADSEYHAGTIDGWYWYLINAPNACRGILILIVFVLTKKHIRKFFFTKFGKFCKKMSPNDRDYSNNDSTSHLRIVPLASVRKFNSRRKEETALEPLNVKSAMRDLQSSTESPSKENTSCDERNEVILKTLNNSDDSVVRFEEVEIISSV